MDSDDLKRKLGINDDDLYRVNPQTGIVEKLGLFGWHDTDICIDPESGVIQDRGIFGWKDTDTRIDSESGIVQDQGIFGWKDTDTRIDSESGVVQDRGIFGWKDSDTRIDSESGIVQDRGIFGWDSDGSYSDSQSKQSDLDISSSDAQSSSYDSNYKGTSTAGNGTWIAVLGGIGIIIGLSIFIPHRSNQNSQTPQVNNYSGRNASDVSRYICPNGIVFTLSPARLGGNGLPMNLIYKGEIHSLISFSGANWWGASSDVSDLNKGFVVINGPQGGDLKFNGEYLTRGCRTY